VNTSANPSASTVKFYPVRNPSTNLDELHNADTTGAGALAVVGANGLLDFAALADPEAVETPEVEYVGKGDVEGRWVAIPVGGAEERWSVKWRDGGFARFFLFSSLLFSSLEKGVLTD
jgi:hypothetical protein